MNNLPAGAEHSPLAPWNEKERTHLLPHEIREIDEECEAEIVMEWGDDWGHNDAAIEAYEKLFRSRIKNFFK